MRALVAFGLLLGLLAAAIHFERDFADRHWPAMWVAYEVDEALGRAPPLVVSGLPTDDTQKLLALLDDLDARLRAARAIPADQYASRADAACAAFRAATLGARLQGVGLPVALPVGGPPIDRYMAAAMVDRLLAAMERSSRSQRAWLDGAPDPQEVTLRLAGRRTAVGEGQARRVVADQGGVVRTLAEIDRKAMRASEAPSRLGSSITVVATGVLLLWLLLVLTDRSAWWLLLLAPVLGAAALTMVALSLGALPLRSIGVRHLAAAGGLVWWPLVAVVAGFMLMRAARYDTVVGPALVSFTEWRGIAVRVVVLVAMAMAVPLFVSVNSLRSEIWLTIAVTALALFAARNSTTLLVTGRPCSLGTPLVLAVGVCIAMLSLFAVPRDLGTLVLAVSLLVAWLVMFARARWAIACVVGMMVVVGWWAGQLRSLDDGAAGALPMASAGDGTACDAAWIEMLPGHDRVETACYALVSQRSDVARSLWLARSGIQAKHVGLGLVDLPAEGRAAAREADRTILQLPADYFAAPMVAAWGWLGLTAFWGFGSVMLMLALRSLKALGEPGRVVSQDLLSSLAGFGLIAVAIRTWITLGGALSGLPLTGQPAPMLSQGTAAGVAAGVFLGIALATPRQSSSSRVAI